MLAFVAVVWALANFGERTAPAIWQESKSGSTRDERASLIT
jgi:hypothetical protein